MKFANVCLVNRDILLVNVYTDGRRLNEVRLVDVHLADDCQSSRCSQIFDPNGIWMDY